MLLGFQADLTGLRQYLNAIQGLPNRVEALAQRLTQIDLGGRALNGDQGTKLARAILQSFEAELRGFGKFERILSSATRGLNLGLPAGELSQLKRQLGDLATAHEQTADRVQRAQRRSSQTKFPEPPDVRRGVEAQQRATQPQTRIVDPSLLRHPLDDIRDELRRSQRPSGQQPQFPPPPPPRSRPPAAGGDDDDDELGREIKALARRLAELMRPIERDRLRTAVGEASSGQISRRDEKGSRRRELDDSISVEQDEILATQSLLDKKQKLLEIERLITSTLREQAAIGRRIRAELTSQESEQLERQKLIDKQTQARLSLAEQQNLASQRLIRNQEQAKVSPTIFAAEQRAKNIGQERLAQQQLAREQSPGIVGAARAAAISPRSGSQFEDTLRTTRGVAAFTVAAFPLYNVMNLVTQTIRELTVGTLQYDEALSKLAVSLSSNRSDVSGFASDLGAVANQFGLSQDVGVEAGSRAIGTFGLNQQGLTDADKRTFIQDALTIAGQLSYQSGTTDIVNVQQNLAGTLRSFGLANDQIGQLADSTTVVSKRFGLLATDLLNTTAQIGGLAKAGGFSLAQTQAIVASQATRTGQSPDAVAGFLSQVFAQADSTNVRSKFRSVGVDTQGTTLAQQVEQLAALVEQGKISSARLNDIASAFGRGRSSDAFRGLIQGFSDTQAAAADAESRPGAARDVFQQLFNNMNAEVRSLVGNLRGIATEFAKSGALDALGGLVIALERMTSVAYDLLQVFNEIPRPLRSAVINMLAFSFAARKIIEIGGVVKVLQNVGAVLKSLNIFSTAGAVPLGATGAQVAGNVGSAVVQREVAELTKSQRRALALQTALNRPASEALRAAPGGLARGAAGLPGAIRGGASTAIAALGGPAGAAALVTTLAAAGVFEAVRARGETERALDRADQLGNTARTTAELREAAAAQQRAIAQAREEGEGGFDLRTIGTVGLAPLIALATNRDDIERAEQRARALNERAAQLETQDQAEVGTVAAFNGFQSTQDVAQALDDMSNAGFNAVDRLNAVTEAMGVLAEQSRSTAAAVIPEGGQRDFVSLFGSAATRAIQSGIDESRDRADATASGFGSSLLQFTTGINRAGYLQDQQTDRLERVDTDAVAKDLDQFVSQYLTGLGKTGEGQQELSTEELQGLNAAVQTRLRQTLGPKIAGLDRDLQEMIFTFAASNARNLLNQQFGTGADTTVTPQVIQTQLSTGLQELQPAFDYQSQTDALGAARTRRDKLRQQVEAARSQASALSDPKDAKEAFRFIAEAERTLAEYDRSYSELLAVYNSSVARTGISRNDSSALLANQVRQARDLLSTITDPQKRADQLNQIADLVQQQQQQQLGLLEAQSQARLDPRDQRGQAATAVQNARRRLDYLKRHRGGELEIAQAQSALNEALNQQREVALSIDKARAASRIQPGDAVAAAQLALRQAQQDKENALRGSAEYYNALTAIAQARREVANALINRQNNADLLRIDLTNPVAQAQAAIRAARRRLSSATGPDDRESAQLELRNAQNQAEAAAFQQRLSDVQTAEQLGRISHRAYLEYLQSEHNRLASIGKRTRQQQEQLNQIDLLMKAANDELNGQFNIGNIKLPTIYEVRRAIQAGSTGVGDIARYNSSAGMVRITDNSSRQVVLNGVPLAEVIKYVQSVLGTNSSRLVSPGGI